jgi:hypothetical protein
MVSFRSKDESIRVNLDVFVNVESSNRLRLPLNQNQREIIIDPSEFNTGKLNRLPV